MMYGNYQNGKSCWKTGAWRFLSTLLLVAAGAAALIVLYDLHEQLQAANVKALVVADEQNNLVTQLQIETEEKKKISETWQKQKREWEAERETILNDFADERKELDQKIQDANKEIVAAKEELNKLREDLATLRVAAEPKPEVTTQQIKAELSVAVNDSTVIVTSETQQAS